MINLTSVKQFCKDYTKIENYEEAAKNRAKITEDTRRKQSESHKGLRWKLIDGNRVYYRNEEDASLG